MASRCRWNRRRRSPCGCCEHHPAGKRLVPRPGAEEHAAEQRRISRSRRRRSPRTTAARPCRRPAAARCTAADRSAAARLSRATPPAADSEKFDTPIARILPAVRGASRRRRRFRRSAAARASGADTNRCSRCRAARRLASHSSSDLRGARGFGGRVAVLTQPELREDERPARRRQRLDRAPDDRLGMTRIRKWARCRSS